MAAKKQTKKKKEKKEKNYLRNFFFLQINKEINYVAAIKRCPLLQGIVTGQLSHSGFPISYTIWTPVA